jgi:NADH-ubiquinone oxidoreductase chain 5
MTVAYRTAYTYLTQKWHFDQLVNEATVKVMNFGYQGSFQLIDKGNIEMLGPSGLSFSLQKSAMTTSVFQAGLISN